MIIIIILKQTATTTKKHFVTKPTVHILTDEHILSVSRGWSATTTTTSRKIRLESQIMSCVVFIKYNDSLLHFKGTEYYYYEISTADGNGWILISPDSSNFFYHHSDSVDRRIHTLIEKLKKISNQYFFVYQYQRNIKNKI